MEEKKLLRGAFPKTTREVKGSNSPIADLNKRRKSTQLFAVVTQGETATSFKVLTRYGRSYTVKYAHLPHVIHQGAELFIILYDLQILITGRGLETIDEAIANAELLWVKESSSGKDDEKSTVFIETIQARGSVHKLMSKLKNDD